MLTCAADYPLYLKALRIHLTSNFGAIGQSIITNTPIPIELPEPRPDYDDPRINSRTKLPIVNSRMYAQVNPTQEQRDDPGFDDSDLDLTESAKILFAKNNDAHKESKAEIKKEIEKFREIDDQLLNLLYSTQTLAVKEILSSNIHYPAFNALAADCIHRSSSYLEIMANQFSKGNSKSNINEITKFLSLSQESGETEAAWTNRLVEHFNRIEPILSPAPSVTVLLRMLLCMVLIKGTDRRHYSNMRAIEVFVDKYPDLVDSLQHFEELRTGILSRVGGDLNHNDDSISAQGSAFPAVIECPSSALAASTQPPIATEKKPRTPRAPGTPTTKGAHKPGRTDHCTYCLTHFSKYHYHKVADCRFKKQGITATSANLATPTNSPPTPTEEQMRTYLASMGYVLPDTDDEA
jgi:hypothetical protein